MNSEVRFKSPNLKITITLGVTLAVTIIILAMLFRFEFSLILLAIAGSIALVGIAGLVGIGGKILYRFKVWRLDIATRQQDLRLATYKADKAQLEAFVLSFPSSQRQLVSPNAPVKLIEATASYKELPAGTQAPIELLPALDSVQRVLIVGPSNAGKTDLLKWVVTRRFNNSQVVIIDPHSYVDKWPYGQVIGIGRNYPEIDRTLEALVQLMQKRYQQIGRGEVKEGNHKRVCVCVDEWRAITGNLPKAGDALKTLLTESRKASMSMFVASHSDRAKPLGLSGEYDLKSGFVIIRLSIQNGERIATIDNGDGPQPARLPGPYISSQVIEGDDCINLEPEPSPAEAHILKLYEQGESISAIAEAVFGSKGGNQNQQVKDVLTKFDVA